MKNRPKFDHHKEVKALFNQNGRHGDQNTIPFGKHLTVTTKYLRFYQKHFKIFY
jgi:hypothetical protein